MPVEARIVADEGGSDLLGESEAVTGAARVRPQRDIARKGMDAARAQLGIAAEATRGEQRRPRGDRPSRAIGVDHLSARDASVLERQALRPCLPKHVAVLVHQALAGVQVPRHVDLAPAAVAEHRHRIADLDAERPHPIDAGRVVVDDAGAEVRVSPGLTAAMTAWSGAVQTKPA